MKWWQWLILAFLAALAMLVSVDINPPAPEATTARYHVESHQDGLVLYLAFPKWRDHLWVVTEDQAWPFADKASAQLGADRFGGEPVPIRKIN